MNPEDPREFVFGDLEWASYVNPLALLWLYYILALESKFLLKPQVRMRVFICLLLFCLSINTKYSDVLSPIV